MKKLIQLFVVAALVLTVVGLARNSAAGPRADAGQSQPLAGAEALELDLAAHPTHIIVTGSGSYLVGGVCKFEANFKATDIKNEVDAEVPVRESRLVPFIDAGDLYYPGCHVVHFKEDKIVDEARSEDGDWKVCFGKRPDIGMTVYYYLDNPPGGVPSWIALPTSVEGDFACAPAVHTGVYMPAGEVIPGGAIGGGDEDKTIPITGPGTVQVPDIVHEIRGSGKYFMGGICTLDVLYKVEGLSDNFYEEFPVEDNVIVSFPDNGDLLFFPGCHVLHYELIETKQEIQPEMTEEKGEWKICFAAPPNLKTTIYFYESLLHEDDPEDITPPWVALPTTMEDGLACAPAEKTGVYVPASQ